MSDLAVAGVAYAEAYCGMWIARCPRPWCASALRLERGQSGFVCIGDGGCGFAADIVWPADPDGIETLLRLRPVPGTRNWLPGEKLADLLTENAVHGVLPELDPALDQSLAVIADERLVGGLLQQQLVAAARPQIGA